VKQRFNEDILNENGEIMLSFCANNELPINNTFFDHKAQQQYTWQNARGHQAVMDYILTNRKFHPSQILDVRCLISVDIGSDHNLLLGKIMIKMKKVRSRPAIFLKQN
jgi:hypothetical protein